MEPPHQHAEKASLLVLAYSGRKMSHKDTQDNSTMQQGLVNGQDSSHNIAATGIDYVSEADCLPATSCHAKW